MSRTGFDVQTLKRHELSAIFGDMPREDFDALKESIQRAGLMDRTIKLLDGEVLDRWHRFKACQELDKLYYLEFEAWDDVSDGDPKVFVRARNMERRHLTPAQRAQIAVTFNERFEKEGDRRSDDFKPSNDGLKNGDVASQAPKTREQLAEQLAEEAKVGIKTIDRAIQVEKAGEAEAVISGEKSASQALLRSNRLKARDAYLGVWGAFEKSALFHHMNTDDFVKAASAAVQCPAEWPVSYRDMESPEKWIVRFESIKKALEQESDWVKTLLAGFRDVRGDAALEPVETTVDTCVVDGYDIQSITIDMKAPGQDAYQYRTFTVPSNVSSENAMLLSMIPDDILKLLIHLATGDHSDVKERGQ